MSELSSRIGRVSSTTWGWVAAGMLVIVAAGLRLCQLDSLPSGMHGDEAFWGLLSERVTHEGWIGPYTSGVAGAPTGTTYLMAPALALLGHTMFAVRVMSALGGTLGVLALYFVARRSLGGWVAFGGAMLLATLGWHLHFSRTGFPLIWWPLVTLLAAYTAVLAGEELQRHEWRWQSWAACGALSGLGLYIYNAQPLYGALIGLFLLVAIVRSRAWRLGLRGLAVATVAGVIVLLPMLNYARVGEHEYFEHFQDSSITKTDAWRQRDSLVSKLELIGDRYIDHWQYLYDPQKIDPVDGTGKVALVPQLFLYLAALGMLLTLVLKRRRAPLLLFGILVVLLMPVSSATTEGGLIRRSFAAAPFLALFAAVTLAELVRVARRCPGWQRWVFAAFAVVVAGATTIASLNLYFNDFADRDVQRVVLADDMTDATQFMLTLPDDAYVYFYADRWSFDYTIRRFLAPDVRGENRSREFGAHGSFNTTVDSDDGQPVFILLGAYRDEFARIIKRYPGGKLTVGGPAGNPTFIAYEVR